MHASMHAYSSGSMHAEDGCGGTRARARARCTLTPHLLDGSCVEQRFQLACISLGHLVCRDPLRRLREACLGMGVICSAVQWASLRSGGGAERR